MAYVCGSLSIENQVQLLENIYMIALDEVNFALD
jgi:hypothetical protein